MKNNEKNTQYNTVLGVLLALLGAILYSTKAVLVKYAYTYYEIDPVTLLMFRMLFALPFFIGIAFVTSRQEDAYQSTRKDYWQIIFLGLAGFYMASFLDFKGLTYITASLERLILFTYPTIVVLIGVLYYKEKLKSGQLAALILTYIGIAIVYADNQSISSQNDLMTGALFVFGSAIAYALYLVGSGQLVPKMGAWKFTSNVLIVSCIAVITHYLIINGGIGELNFPIPIYIIALLMAIISTVIPTLLFSEGIRLIGASNASIIGSVGPISTITLAYIFLGERLTMIQLLGGSLVLVGVLIISLQKHSKKKG